MSKKKVVRVSEEELALLEQLRSGKLEKPAVTEATSISDAHKDLANAFVEAIERTKPKQKVTIADRKPRNPWMPKDGSPKLKMKRHFFHHGIELGNRVSNEEIELLNKVRPGSYCEGFVRVTLRKDRGIDIDYPVKTASQRLKLVNQFGIRSFVELLQRLIDEHDNPKKYTRPDDLDLFEENA